MSIGFWPALRIVAVCAAAVVYVLFAHYASSLPPAQAGPVAVLAMLPYLAAGVLLAWRSRHRAAWLLGCAALAALTWLQTRVIGEHAAWLYFAQHALGMAFLAAVFGISLVGSRVPLCSRIALAMHGTLEPGVARYTRQVTIAWTVFFAACATLSTALFAFAPPFVWSLFANLLTLPLVVLMFAVEYWIRLRLLPDVEHASILDAIRLYFRAMRASPPPTS